MQRGKGGILRMDIGLQHFVSVVGAGIFQNRLHGKVPAGRRTVGRLTDI